MTESSSLAPSGYAAAWCSRDEFDPATVERLASDLRQILAAAVAAPDQDWRTL